MKEISYSSSLKSQIPTIIAILLGMILLLSIAIKKIPLGTAYAIWTGIGAVGGFIFAIILFGEVASFERVLFLILIVAGITGLKLTSKA